MIRCPYCKFGYTDLCYKCGGKAHKAANAMLQMHKIDIAELEKAFNG